MTDNDFAIFVVLVAPAIGPATRVADIKEARDRELDALRAPSLPIILSVFLGNEGGIGLPSGILGLS